MDLAKLAIESARIAGCATISETTRRNYSFDWRLFTAWCKQAELEPLPAVDETVILFLTDMLASHKISSVARLASAIAHYHREAKYSKTSSGRVTALLSGARRQRHERPEQKSPLTVEQLRKIMRRLNRLKDSLSVRSSSILTIGFASALRRSNIVGLRLADIARVPEGYVLWVGREKNHQHGPGREIGIQRGAHPETCPIRALDRWLNLRGSEEGPLYCRIINGRIRPHLNLRPCNVAHAVKAAVRLIGLDATRFAGHSLRAGFVTAGVLIGLSDLAIARQTGHRSLESLRDYFRATDLWRSNPSGMVGL